MRNLILSAVLAGASLFGVAQAENIEAGKQYVELSSAVPVSKPGKIEVVELFWYGCPHCYHFEPSLAAGGLTWKLGWEQLGGDGSTAFQTPLATLHAFNGWADKFLVTPANGLDDRYASVSGKFGSGRLDDKLAWTVAWHDFQSDRGGFDYGREWNASLAFPLPAGFSGLVKLADYRSDGYARDTRKLWLQLERTWP